MTKRNQTEVACLPFELSFCSRMIKLQNHKNTARPVFAIGKRYSVISGLIKKTDESYIFMVEGKYLHHPKLEAGGRSRMKIFRVNPNEDLPVKTIKTILNHALNLYRNGTIKIRS